MASFRSSVTRRLLAAAMLVLGIYPGAELQALSGSITGGNLPPINVNINARPTLSGGSPYSGSSPSGGHSDRDWSPGSRATSSGPDLEDLFKPIAQALDEAFRAIELAFKPITDTLDQIRQNLRQKQLAAQLKRDTIAKMRSIVAVKYKEEQALIWPGLQVLTDGEIAWWFGEDNKSDESECDEDEHEKLQKVIDAICKKPQPRDPIGDRLRRCKKEDSCDVLLVKLTERVACSAARYQMMRTCYPDERGKGKHGDQGHLDQYNQERAGIAKCAGYILDPTKHCVEEYRQKMLVLMQKLKLR